MLRTSSMAAVLLAVAAAPQVARDLAARDPALRARDQVAFAPEVGLILHKTLEVTSELELVSEETTIVINGEERPGGGGDRSMTSSEQQTLVFSDEYLAVEDGRATRLARSYDTLSNVSSQEAGDQSEERDGSSELEGLSVVFTWDEDEEEYLVEFAEEDEGGDEDLLAELEGDADLIWFLPGEEVDEGDSWELEADAFLLLANLGGDTRIEYDEDERQREQSREREELFEENLEGEVTCTYEGVEDGIAIIAIEMELASSFEQELVPLPEAMQMTGSTSNAFSFTLEGELSWDVEAGHAVGLLLEGEVELETVRHQENASDDFTFEIHSELVFEGRMRIELTVE